MNPKADLFITPQRQRSRASGFTLIEVIITLVLMGIMASMFSTMFTGAFTQSSQPLQTLAQDVNLSLIMEKMIATYEGYAPTDNGPISQDNLSSLKVTIGAEGETKDLGGGPYYVVENHFVSYDTSGTETDLGNTASDYLKVTIQSTAGANKQTLTYLFTKRPATGS